MKSAKPSITGTIHTLPFDKLSEDDFERLCLWLVEREDFHSAEHLGASGSEQGRDIIAWRDQQQWAFQCKRVKRFGFKTAEEEIEKIRKFPERERPAKYVFMISINVSDTTRRKVRIAYPDMEILFWAGTELDEKVKSHPEIVKEFFFTTEAGPAPVPTAVNKRELREAMVKAFSYEDLEILCSNVEDSLVEAGIELQVNLEMVGGSSKPTKVLNLIEFLDRRGFMDYLVKAVRDERPGSI
ncbi:MAG TPA: restriction endonuclease [Anaerolineales bacterium]|nr:restriction endonuclease [Anaerolineales bacterium]